MRLLVDFLLRFGWGLAVGLVLTPVGRDASAAVSAGGPPGGFFRVNLLVIMGLATFAALVGQATTAAWPLAAIAAVAAWAGSIAWFGERRRAGGAICLVTALLLGGGIVIFHAPSAAAMSSGGAVALSAFGGAATAILSGLVSGLTVHAMLLGHWYLNAPGMRVDLLRRAIDATLVVWGVQLAVSLAAWVGGSMPAVPDGGSLAVPAGGTALALAALRWLAGLVGLPVLLVMARKTLDIPNTQSATGILYVACLAAILGELTAQLLQAAV
jgi:hypothetical protein